MSPTLELGLKLLGMALAVVVGLYWGMSGRDPRSLDEIEEELMRPGQRKRVRRSFMPLDLLHKRRRSSQLRRERERFRTVAPEFTPITGEGSSSRSDTTG